MNGKPPYHNIIYTYIYISILDIDYDLYIYIYIGDFPAILDVSLAAFEKTKGTKHSSSGV